MDYNQLSIEKGTFFKHFFIWCFLIIGLILYCLKGYWSGFYDAIQIMYSNIVTKIDLIVLFYGLIVIPLCIYIFYSIGSIIRAIWETYTSKNAQAYFSIARMVFVQFGVISSVLGFSTSERFVSWMVFGISTGIVLILNLFFIKYDDVLSGDEIPSIWDVIRNAMTIILGVLLTILYYNSPAIKNTMDQTLATLLNDMPFLVVFCLTLIFGFIYPILKAIIIYLDNRLSSESKEKLSRFFKILIFVLYIYFFVKMILVLITIYAPEPYPTLLGMATSIASGLITKNSHQIMDWFSRTRQRFSDK